MAVSEELKILSNVINQPLKPVKNQSVFDNILDRKDRVQEIISESKDDEERRIYYIDSINKNIENITNEFVIIGCKLHEIDSRRLYRDWGYTSISNFTEYNFDFSKTTTRNLILVYRNFCERMVLKPQYENYSFSQLVEMCSMNADQLAECNVEMTVSQLRDIKKQDKQITGLLDDESDIGFNQKLNYKKVVEAIDNISNPYQVNSIPYKNFLKGVEAAKEAISKLL